MSGGAELRKPDRAAPQLDVSQGHSDLSASSVWPLLCSQALNEGGNLCSLHAGWAETRECGKQINVTATLTALSSHPERFSFAVTCVFKELCVSPVIISRNPEIRSSTLHGAAPMGNAARGSQFRLTSL